MKKLTLALLVLTLAACSKNTGSNSTEQKPSDSATNIAPTPAVELKADDLSTWVGKWKSTTLEGRAGFEITSDMNIVGTTYAVHSGYISPNYFMSAFNVYEVSGHIEKVQQLEDNRPGRYYNQVSIKGTGIYGYNDNGERYNYHYPNLTMVGAWYISEGVTSNLEFRVEEGCLILATWTLNDYQDDNYPWVIADRGYLYETKFCRE